MELVAQGTANIFSSIFGGIPATGAIARTATNVKNGGRTPVAGIVHAITLLLIMLSLSVNGQRTGSRWQRFAGILVVVGIQHERMGKFSFCVKGREAAILTLLLTTFLLTVFVDLLPWRRIGMVLAAFLFLRKDDKI